MTIYIGRNQVEIRSWTTLVCFVTIWCKEIQGLSPSKRNGRGFTTNSARVTNRRSLVDIFLVVGALPPFASFWAAGTGGGAGDARHVGVSFPSNLWGFSPRDD